MKRKKQPLERIAVTDEAAKAKVALVLEVLSGEKSIGKACEETGINMLQYYKLEEKMLRAMMEAALMPSMRRRGPSPAAEATTLAAETEALRAEHRRMRSLVRVSRKLLGLGTGKPRKTALRGPKTEVSPGLPAAEMPKRRGRPPKAASMAPDLPAVASAKAGPAAMAPSGPQEG